MADRSKLRQAIAAYNSARQEVQEARAALARAGTIVEAVRRELHALGDVDGEIAAQREERLGKAASLVAAGGSIDGDLALDELGDLDLDINADLKRAKVAQDTASRKVSNARAVEAKLASDLAAADEKLKAANADSRAAAVEVLQSELKESSVDAFAALRRALKRCYVLSSARSVVLSVSTAGIVPHQNFLPIDDGLRMLLDFYDAMLEVRGLERFFTVGDGAPAPDYSKVLDALCQNPDLDLP